MAVVTVKSAAITNRDAAIRKTNPRVQGQMVRYAVGKASIANGDSVGSKYILFTLPSNALVPAPLLSAPDIGVTTAADFGLYRTTGDGGALVSAAFFAAAQALNAGPYTRVPLTAPSLADREKMIWEALGLAADPMCDYDVVATLTGAADAAGDILLEAEYTQ